MFSKYHYLNHSHNNASSVYLAIVNNVLVGFISIIHFPHPKIKNMKKVHRLVILPEYQGIGLGVKLLNEIANIYKKQKYRLTITTSSPSLINTLKKSLNWKCIRYNRVGKQSTSTTVGKMVLSGHRYTASFEIK
jgi:GNAT superfamily N-acetyltransferase